MILQLSCWTGYSSELVVRTLEGTSVVICSTGYSSVSVVGTLEGTLVEMLSLDAILT